MESRREKGLLSRIAKFWNDLPRACFGVSAAGFLCHLFWYFRFQSHNPRQPDVRNGLVYPFDIKGHPVYVSASDKNLIAIASILATGFLFLFLAAAWQRQTTPLHVRQFERESVLSFLVSFSLTIALYLIFGRSVANFLASKGVVLIW